MLQAKSRLAKARQVAKFQFTRLSFPSNSSYIVLTQFLLYEVEEESVNSVLDLTFIIILIQTNLLSFGFLRVDPN